MWATFKTHSQRWSSPLENDLCFLRCCNETHYTISPPSRFNCSEWVRECCFKWMCNGERIHSWRDKENERQRWSGWMMWLRQQLGLLRLWPDTKTSLSHRRLTSLVSHNPFSLVRDKRFREVTWFDRTVCSWETSSDNTEMGGNWEWAEEKTKGSADVDCSYVTLKSFI